MTTPDEAQWRRPPAGEPARDLSRDPEYGTGWLPAPATPPAGGTPTAPPTAGTPAAASTGGTPAAGTPWRPGYTGPPPSTPPPPGWRPEFVVQPAPPRQLPAQDYGAVDAREASARTLTYGVGMVAGAVVLVLLCLLCGRAMF